MAGEGGTVAGEPVVELAEGLEMRMVEVADLREQDVNAQVMEPEKFERLVANIKERGALESVPYCSQKGDHVEIVSGHHRVRAARAAGLKRIWVMVDTHLTTRSLVTAKQIAHNSLVGHSDEEVLRRMVDSLTSPDDLLLTGLDVEMLPIPDSSQLPAVSTPRADFQWRTVTFTFLPHQLADFTELIERLEASELVGLAPMEIYNDFAQALAGYMRFRNIRHAGTAIHALTKAALEAVDG